MVPKAPLEPGTHFGMVDEHIIQEHKFDFN